MIAFKKYTTWLLHLPLLTILRFLWPLVGVLLVGYGAYQIYKPAGWIAVGGLMIFDSLHSDWMSRKKPE